MMIIHLFVDIFTPFLALLGLLIGHHGDQQGSRQVWVVSAKIAPTLGPGYLRDIFLDERSGTSLQQLSRVHVCQ
jgi:hypothetical protein